MRQTTWQECGGKNFKNGNHIQHYNYNNLSSISIRVMLVKRLNDIYSSDTLDSSNLRMV